MDDPFLVLRFSGSFLNSSMWISIRSVYSSPVRSIIKLSVFFTIYRPPYCNIIRPHAEAETDHFLHRFLKMTPNISQRRIENNKEFIKTVVANKLTEVVKSYAPCVDIFLQSLQNINIHGKLFRITHTRFSLWRGLLWTARSLII